MQNAFEGCAAAFLPEIKRGHALCNIYDAAIFYSKTEEQEQWQTMHHGKVISIPRPVYALRVWNPLAGGFEEISASMPGAPTADERESHWVSFLDELREHLHPKYGPTFIDDCIHLDKEEVKRKYF